MTDPKYGLTASGELIDGILPEPSIELVEALVQNERRNKLVQLERQAVEDQLFNVMSRANTAFSSYRSGNAAPAFDNLQELARDIPALLERMSTVHQRAEQRLRDEEAAFEAAVEREALPYSFAKHTDKIETDLNSEVIL